MEVIKVEIKVGRLSPSNKIAKKAEENPVHKLIAKGE